MARTGRKPRTVTPDRGSRSSGSIQPVSAFERAYPIFAPGSQFHRPPKTWASFHDLSGVAGLLFRGIPTRLTPSLAQVVFESGSMTAEGARIQVGHGVPTHNLVKIAALIA